MNEETKPEPKAERTRSARFSKEAFAQLEQLRQFTKQDWPEIGQLVGYSDGAARHWIARGEAPIVAGLAAEGLLRRYRKEVNGGATILLVRIPPAHLEVVEKFLAALGVRASRVDI